MTSRSSSAPASKPSLSDQWPAFLNATISEVVKTDLSFASMTPVQSAVIPILVNQHKDVVVEAVTGSGKTLAFVIPVLEILLKRSSEFANKKHNIGALIVTPTRELASQIFEVIGTFLKRLDKFKAILFVGGNKLEEDIKAFNTEGANIVVCTPGRFEDLLNQKSGRLNMLAHLKSLEILILDEADRLLDLGFSDSLLTIIKSLPKQRRTGLFSATQTDEIEKLVKVGLRNPCVIQVKQKGNAAAQKTPTTLKNYYLVIEPDKKLNHLLNFLKANPEHKFIIFLSTCAGVEYFTKLVKTFLPDTNVLSMHRKIKSKRNKVFNDFKGFKKGILLCTDILSRGIDIEDVDWVVQYDPPKFASSFVHRCGRTARSGRAGEALLYLLPNEDCYVQFLEINQHVPLSEYQVEIEAKFKLDKTIARIQNMALKDRDFYEKGKQAFVSFIKAYSKHECSHIFKVKELDFSNLAKGFGLLHTPKMPEIKQSDKMVTKFVENLDVSAIPYKDKAREKLRRQKLEQRKKDLESGKDVAADGRKRPANSVAWSNKKQTKLKRKIRKEKHSLAEKKRKNEFDQEEYDELQNDFKLLKKLKKKKISEETFDEQFMDSE